MDGMLSYLQRPSKGDVAASATPSTAPIQTRTGKIRSTKQDVLSEALGSDSQHTSTKVGELNTSAAFEPPLPRFTQSTEFPGVGRRRLHRCTLVQDAHTPGEQVVLNSLYRMAKSPRWGRSQVDGSFLVRAGLRDIAEQTCMHETNVRFNLRSLIEKLAIELVEGEDRRRQTARVYRVFSYKQILDKRRASGLEWVIKNRGVRFVPKDKAEEILASEALPSDDWSETDELPSASLTELGSESLEARGSASLPVVLGSSSLENSFQEASSSLPHNLIKGLQDLIPVFDNEAVTSLWQECRIRARNCTAEEVLFFAKEKSLICRNGKIQNPVGFLLAAVPKCFEGGAFATFREEQRRKADEDRKLEIERQNSIRLQEQRVAEEAEAYRRAEETLGSLSKHEYDRLSESTREKLLKDHPEVRRYPAGELEKLVRRRVLLRLQEQELNTGSSVAAAGRNL